MEVVVDKRIYVYAYRDGKSGSPQKERRSKRRSRKRRRRRRRRRKRAMRALTCLADIDVQVTGDRMRKSRVGKFVDGEFPMTMSMVTNESMDPSIFSFQSCSNDDFYIDPYALRLENVKTKVKM
ncbi:hypothetical protein V1477_004837 [Vespula maculifrons]|uniref:Uncharacterized protein n=1 Tax=Vespula maculifrons TaxID=7453 RepID=A0ABD2CN06_VESMC